MPKPTNRSYSRYSMAAVQLIGSLIKAARKERQLTTLELSERANISRGLLQRIEKGDPHCTIGAVFEAANIVGVKLFDADETSLSKHIRQTEDKLTLLPKSIHKKVRKVNDNF